MKKAVSRSIILFLCTFFSLNAYANTYEYKNDWGSLSDIEESSRPLCGAYLAPRNTSAGYIRSVAFHYDQITHKFRFETIIEGCKINASDASYIQPDSFWLVVNDGPNPKGHAGEMAIMYFDARNAASPIVNIFGYNGANNVNSYFDGSPLTGTQTADRLFSNHSLSNDTNILNALTIEEFTQTGSQGSVPAKKFIIDLDATSIVNHVPIHPEAMQWGGLRFNNKIGVWFHPASGSSFSYCGANDTNARCLDVAPGQDSVGYMKTYGTSRRGSYDTSNVTTNTFPICTGKFDGHTSYNQNKRCYEVEIGDQFHSEITAQDLDTSDTTLLLNYNVPAGATVDFDTSDPSAGGNYPIDNPGVVDMYFTPGLSLSGSRVEADFDFTDPHGATKSCPVSICVPTNNPPVCDIQVTSNNPDQCQGLETIIDFDANGSSDPEGKGLTYQWETDCTTGATLQDKGNGQASITLSEPGKGNGVSGCSVKLIVSDGINPDVMCEVPVAVEPCELDCLDQPNGSAVVDQCGICEGNGTSCLDCAGTPFGNSQVDQCGVCGGTNDCLDCAGTFNGDQKEDLCGVCGGDNSACLDCQERDITEIQFLIDGGVKALEGIINQMLFKIRNEKSKKLQTYITDSQVLAHELQTRNWIISWLFPSVSSDCGETTLCTTVSNVDLIEEYKVHDKELLELGYDVAKKVFRIKRRKAKRRGVSSQKLRRFTQARKRYRKLLLDQYNLNENNLKMVPETFSSCG